MENSAFPGAGPIDAPPDSSLLGGLLWILLVMAGWVAAAGVPALIARLLKLNARVYFGASLLLSPIGGLLLIALIRTPANEAPALRVFARHWLKPLVLIALLIPFGYLALQWGLMLSGQPHAMGWNVGQWTHRYLGDTAIRILLLTLAVSPLRDISGWAPIVLIRRRVGLSAFFYAALHLLAYFWLDRDWSITGLIEDVTIRTYIMLGMAALTLLIPLAITSTNGMIKRLGRKTWDRLHWLIYPLAILAVAHNLLMVKAIDGAPSVHATILAVLLGWRVARWAIGRLKPAEAIA